MPCCRVYLGVQCLRRWKNGMMDLEEDWLCPNCRQILYPHADALTIRTPSGSTYRLPTQMWDTIACWWRDCSVQARSITRKDEGKRGVVYFHFSLNLFNSKFSQNTPLSTKRHPFLGKTQTKFKKIIYSRIWFGLLEFFYVKEEDELWGLLAI